MASTIRPATTGDLPAIEAVHRAAFPTDLEARLVALLITRGKATISMVAEVEGQVVGHILFSPAQCGPLRAPTRSVGRRTEESSAESELEIHRQLQNPPLAEQADHSGLGLAPVAVLPAFQNRGFGSALVRAGLAECRRLADVRPAGPAGLEADTDSALRMQGPARQAGPTEDHFLIHWVVVLGHPTYYPRFGFAPARHWNLTGDYGDSDAFQFLPITPAAAALRGGHIRYAPEFGEIFGSGI